MRLFFFKKKKKRLARIANKEQKTCGAAASLRQPSETTAKDKRREREKKKKSTWINKADGDPSQRRRANTSSAPSYFFSFGAQIWRRRPGFSNASFYWELPHQPATSRWSRQGVLEGQRSSFNRNGIVVLCLAAGVMSGTFFLAVAPFSFFFFF